MNLLINNCTVGREGYVAILEEFLRKRNSMAAIGLPYRFGSSRASKKEKVPNYDYYYMRCKLHHYCLTTDNVRCREFKSLFFLARARFGYFSRINLPVKARLPDRRPHCDLSFYVTKETKSRPCRKI